MSTAPAYAAGLFDGEGCVLVSPSLQLVVTFSMTDSEPLRFLNTIYGGTFSSRDDLPSGRPMFRLQISGARNVLAFLRDILPYSLGRKEQIEEALTWPCPGRWYSRFNPIPDGVRARRRQIRENLVLLKRVF